MKEFVELTHISVDSEEDLLSENLYSPIVIPTENILYFGAFSVATSKHHVEVTQIRLKGSSEEIFVKENYDQVVELIKS